jgi:hypothetical protein
MHVCTCMIRCMTQAIGPGPFELGEDLLAERAAANRAIALLRLEKIWEQVELNLDPELGADPRWAEIGLRVIDREAKLLRLDVPEKVEADEDALAPGVDRGELIELQLRVIEESLRPHDDHVNEP